MKFKASLILPAGLLVLASEFHAETYTGGNFFHNIFSPGRRRGIAGRFDFAGGLTSTTAAAVSCWESAWGLPTS